MAAQQKVRSSFYLPVELVESARDCVVQLAGPPEQLTLSALVESALRKEIARLQRKHNEDKTFPRRNSEPRSGRPVSK